MTAMKKVAIFLPPALSALLLWAAFPPLGETANVFSIWMNFSGSVLASWWGRTGVKRGPKVF